MRFWLTKVCLFIFSQLNLPLICHDICCHNKQEALYFVFVSRHFHGRKPTNQYTAQNQNPQHARALADTLPRPQELVVRLVAFCLKIISLNGNLKLSLDLGIIIHRYVPKLENI